MSQTPPPSRRRQLLTLGLVALAAAGATVLVLMLNANVATRQAEALQTSFQIVSLDETTVDPAQWGVNYPRQYDAYLRTSDPTAPSTAAAAAATRCRRADSRRTRAW
jgi:nitrite reductase (cytochrome c-552)